MAKYPQVEIKTGGFYEPILPIIPDEDRYVQIEKLTKYIEELTGYVPTGMWLTERVWEPHLAQVLSKAKIKHVSVDESHFKLTGFSKQQLRGYFITEEQNNKLAIFPISKDLLIQRLEYSIALHFHHNHLTLKKIALQQK
ncbi:unnamed protein product [marine sediment metagenome]|uniref:Glycoside hydrolase family 57 N-terminal domain-containing protein n=1 Tax=marine sediment metagenome TaxID=412755 RepID=X1B126_9ZZZZ